MLLLTILEEILLHKVYLLIIVILKDASVDKIKTSCKACLCHLP